MSANLHKEKITNTSLPAWHRLTQAQRWAGNAEAPLSMRLGRTSHLVTSALEQALGFSYSQIRILFGALEPEGVIQATISKLAKVDPAAITRSLQAMERDGLIRREPDPKDNRCIRIFVTQKGQALAQTIPGKIAEFEASLTEGLQDEEILVMHRLLLHLENQLFSGNAGIIKKEGKSEPHESKPQ
jgi:DNA-binding MarR family transcriptional regulator